MTRRWRKREKAAAIAFALLILVGLVGMAFAAGYILGKLLL